jgi:hypothetical protein
MGMVDCSQCGVAFDQNEVMYPDTGYVPRCREHDDREHMTPEEFDWYRQTFLTAEGQKRLQEANATVECGACGRWTPIKLESGQESFKADHRSGCPWEKARLEGGLAVAECMDRYGGNPVALKHDRPEVSGASSVFGEGART